VPLLYVNIKCLVKELPVMSFHTSCDSYYCCDWWMSALQWYKTDIYISNGW